MTESTRARLALAAAGGILAAIAGCGGAPAAPAAVPGSPVDEDTAGGTGPATRTAPAEEHARGAAHGCNAAAMQPKATDPPPSSPGAPQSR
jgi:hypothetical protein